MDSPIKDISFSSYLKPQNHTPNSKENGADDAELSVFDARKYFSDSSNPKDIKTWKQQEVPDDVRRPSSVSSVDGYGKNFRTRSFRAKPTASSEASWNSRTGLLGNLPKENSPRNFPADNLHKNDSAVKKWFLGRKCCCRGKKAVQVKEVIVSEHKGADAKISTANSTDVSKSNCLNTKWDHNNKVTALQNKSIVMDPLPLSPDIGFGSTEAPRKQRISASGRPFLDGAISFTFPILNPSTNQPNKSVLIGAGGLAKPTINLSKYSEAEITPVSGPPIIGNCVNGRGDFNPRSPMAEDDAASETSSDLFEIENFSIHTESYPVCGLDEDCAIRFNSINRINSVEYERVVADEAAAESYAPSEVSIDLSVVTAEGGGDKASVANFSSVSCSELLKQRVEETGRGEKPRDNSGLMFMGCRQVKAVSVAEQPLKRTAVEGGRPPRGNKPPAGSCQSARQSLAFAA